MSARERLRRLRPLGVAATLLAAAAAGPFAAGSAQPATVAAEGGETAQPTAAAAGPIAGEAASAEPAGPVKAARTSCTACHGDADLFGEEGPALVAAVAAGAHGEAGLSCHDCHGGNPDPALADDLDAAMDPEFAPNPYRGAPARTEIPSSCGRCHSDPVLMRRFRPDLRVDQEEEYWTSHHGRGLAAGDPAVATCVDCHRTHGILGAGDPESPVYPTRVAETCGTCHADAERMAGYATADGRPLPTDQLADWRSSVHAAGLLEGGDLSAPTCNDCHGNHGATPPGVESVAFVCGQCHGREATLFRQSAKRAGFQEHNELIAGTEGCGDCHSEPEPQAALAGVAHFTECATCHGNHAVGRPAITMLAPLPAVPCAFCHEPAGAPAPVPEPPGAERRYERVRDELVAAARARGLADEALFDALLAEARALEPHTVAGEAGGRAPRPEFERLWEKFRLPPVPRPARTAPVSCADCHGPETMLAAEAAGWETSAAMLSRLQELTAWTARAERILLEARRGGVQIRAAQEAVDHAVDAQIELQVLVHTFSAAEDGAFLAKQAEGMEHAEEALRAGRAALDELRFRRVGLAASLVVVLVVLVALALKIRSLTADEPAG